MRLIRLLPLPLLALSTAQADFTTETTSKVTSGMARIAAALSGQAREPVQMVTMFKGNRMVTTAGDAASVIDLDAETMTDINFKERSYSVLTFAQLAEAIARLQRETGQAAALQGKAEVTRTGQTRQVLGIPTENVRVAVSMVSPSDASASAAMALTMDMWMAKDIPGAREQQDFYRRMSAKMAFSPQGGMAAANSPFAKALSDAFREAGQLEGLPLLTVSRFGAPIGLTAGGQQPPEELAASSPAPTPTSEQLAGAAAAGAIGGRMGRAGGLAAGLGGFGGFGRKKKPAVEEPAPPTPVATQPAPTRETPGVLMTMESEVTRFSSDPVDASKFAVPAGFSRVPHSMEKALPK